MIFGSALLSFIVGVLKPGIIRLAGISVIAEIVSFLGHDWFLSPLESVDTEGLKIFTSNNIIINNPIRM